MLGHDQAAAARERVDDAVDLLRRQLGEHREGENSSGAAFGALETARTKIEIGVRRLQMDRNRVVDAGSDAALALTPFELARDSRLR